MAAALLMPAPTNAEAEEPAVLLPLLIVEVQTAGASSSTEEFVEIFNPNPITIDITGWQLQYRSASAQADDTWPASSTKATVVCAPVEPGCAVTINPNKSFTFVRNLPTPTQGMVMSGGFAEAGGQIRFIKPTAGSSPVVQDFIGYGSAADAETQAAAKPSSGQSLRRKLTADGIFIDTQNNFNDFAMGCTLPTPEATDRDPTIFRVSCEEEITTPPSSEPEPSNEEPAIEPPEDAPAIVYLPLIITELLPDPASPQQDARDEFIELFNPNNQSVNLNGYSLQTGNSTRGRFTIGDITIQPGAYLHLNASITNISLTNSGSSVQLYNPDDGLIDESPDYGAAKEGQSWMKNETGWHWSTTPSPGSANILTLPPPKPVPLAPVKKAAAPAVKKITAPKTPATKKTVSPAQTAPAFEPASIPPKPPNLWLLIPISLLVLSYAAYEYRIELVRALRKTRQIVTNKGDKSEPDLSIPQKD